VLGAYAANCFEYSFIGAVERAGNVDQSAQERFSHSALAHAAAELRLAGLDECGVQGLPTRPLASPVRRDAKHRLQYRRAIDGQEGFFVVVIAGVAPSVQHLHGLL
jgi:hypothetical protein